MIYLCNSFSVHMLPRMRCDDLYSLEVQRVSASAVQRLLRNNAYRSHYGHEETVSHLGRYLGLWIPVNREPLKMGPRDTLILATLMSKREYELGYRTSPKWQFYQIRLK